MLTEQYSQVLCGPFSSKELPSYQATQQVFQTWQPFLSRNMIYFLQGVIDRTARFGKKYRFIAKSWFFEGHNPRQATGYAGCTPMPPVSDKTFYAIRVELQRLGVLRVRNSVYTINYSITALHLATDESVQRRVLHENKRGGVLSTIEGILSWASGLVERAIPGRETEPKQGQSHINKGSPYTFHYKNYVLLPDKSGNNAIGGILDRVREFFMGERTAAQIAQDVHSSVALARNKVSDKRKKRRTLADQVALFESEWAKGQREFDGSVPPNRIVGKDRALLKSQIIRNTQGTSIDVEAFAHWVAFNWQAIGAQYFAKAKSYPERPVVPWLVKCFETYIIAYQQKNHLDKTGTRSIVELTRRADLTDKMQHAGQAVIAETDATIAALKAKLADKQIEIQKLKRSKATTRPSGIGEWDTPTKPRRVRLRK